MSSKQSAFDAHGSTKSAAQIHKDLEKFTRYFIVKTVQVIVQSRIGDSNNYVRTQCKPNGNDWFNLNITDLKEVSERTKSSLDSVFNENFSIRTNWRICCEIFVRTNDDQDIVLETWIISNKVIDFPAHLSKLSHVGPSRSSTIEFDNYAARDAQTDPTPNGSDETKIFSPNGISMNGNIQTASFRLSSNRSPCSTLASGKNGQIYLNNENNNLSRRSSDIKSSVSCSSLSTAAGKTNCSSFAANNSSSLAGNSRFNSSSSLSTSSSSISIYSIYNKMSLLLKTLMTTTRITPAYLTTNRGQTPNSHEVCYRIYGSRLPPSFDETQQSDKTQDQNRPYPNMLDIRDFVKDNEIDRFSPLTKLGSVSSPINELELVFCYRKDLRFGAQDTQKDCINLVQRQRNLFDEECLTAARQLLANNNYRTGLEAKDGKLNRRDDTIGTSLTDYGQPLSAAFASSEKTSEKLLAEESNANGLDNAFEKLLLSRCSNGFAPPNESPSSKRLVKINNHPKTKVPLNDPPSHNIAPNDGLAASPARSKPVQIPASPGTHGIGLSPTLSGAGGAPYSLSDSYVFVDLNPPFASENQSDLNAFFHGPSPTFSSNSDAVKNVSELTNQLASIEASAEILDDFVDTICASEERSDDEDDDVEADYDHRIGDTSFSMYGRGQRFLTSG